MTRYTLTFDEAEPDAVDQLGGKGAGLARMTQYGLRVPPGYILTTDACRRYFSDGALPEGLTTELLERLADLERRSGKAFGGGPTPLLLSVRSGAPVSMPGMMDTILNLGLGREAAIALAEATGDTKFVAELLARFHAMYSEIVLGAQGQSPAVDEVVASVGRGDDPSEVYEKVWSSCAQALMQETGEVVPTEPHKQLLGAVEAVFRSWNTRRARAYRDFHAIPHDLGTAVVVQSMVFGNHSADSGSGVVFTRDPATGEPGLFGEYLANSQGEDVVAGLRTPDPVREALPADVMAELEHASAELEAQQGDVLDIEFTVERSTLYFLQVRSAKRTPEAAVRIAADFLAEGRVDPDTVFDQVTVEHVRQVQRPGFAVDEVDQARTSGRWLTTAIGASPGQVSGALVLDSDRAKNWSDRGQDVVLARPVTSPSDLHGMIAAQGIVTATGGSTSHAAVVARALGKSCVVGAAAIEIDAEARTLSVGDRVIREGELVSLDGATGEVFVGEFSRATASTTSGALSSLLEVARNAASCEVFARVTLPGDVERALDAGATGLVTALDDVLAATGHLDTIVRNLLANRESRLLPDDIADTVAAEFAPLLAAAGDRDVGVRAIDFVADESRELLQQTALTTQYPQLAVPLGLPELIEAQVEGLNRAVAAVGSSANVHLAVRHISDPGEAMALRRLQRTQPSAPAIGSYLTSPRAVVNFEGIAEDSDVLWIEVRVLQAALFGIPPRQLLTAEPLDGYVRRGLLSVDPRTSIDVSMDDLLSRVAQRSADFPQCRIGMRLSGAVSQQVVARLYELGLRRFAVDLNETRPVTLALGKAALASRHSPPGVA